MQLNDKMVNMKKLLGLGYIVVIGTGLVACSSPSSEAPGTMNNLPTVAQSSSASEEAAGASPTASPSPTQTDGPIVPQNPEERSETEQAIVDRWSELVSVLPDVLERNTVTSDIVQPYFNGDARGTAIVTLLAVGATVSQVDANEDGSFTMIVVDENNGPLMNASGFWYADGRYMTFTQLNETSQSSAFRQHHAAELMAVWPTSGGS